MAGFSAVSTRRQLHPRAGAVGGRSASVFRRDFEIGHKAECELVSLAHHSGTTGAVQHCAPLSELHGLVQSPPRRSWSLQCACRLHVPSQPGPPHPHTPCSTVCRSRHVTAFHGGTRGSAGMPHTRGYFRPAHVFPLWPASSPLRGAPRAGKTGLFIRIFPTEAARGTEEPLRSSLWGEERPPRGSR